MGEYTWGSAHWMGKPQAVTAARTPAADTGKQVVTIHARLPMPPQAGASGITPQQWRVLALMVQGDQNKQIAYKLGVGEPTVKAHVTVILRKLGVRSRTQAVIEARGLALPPA